MTPSRAGFRKLPHGLELLYEDRDILVVNKPAGLLTIGTDKERERTAYFILMDYVRKGSAKSRNRVFSVHRLDKDTSGVLILAKNADAKRVLQGEWEETLKYYLAIVHGRLAKPSAILESYLTENDSGFVHSTRVPARGKLSRTGYRVLSENTELALLEVELLTGRKHQIRVQFADIGHPVAGDKKYNQAKDGFPRLALHAWRIVFAHPYTGERMEFTGTPPAHFGRFSSVIEKEARGFRDEEAVEPTPLEAPPPGPPRRKGNAPAKRRPRNR